MSSFLAILAASCALSPLQEAAPDPAELAARVTFQNLPPGKWVEHPESGKWYGLTEAGSWEECRLAAESMDGFLVTIRSMREMDWLRAQFGRERVWIGLHDSKEEAVFRWHSGEKSDFRFWSWGCPDNFGMGEHHVYMNHGYFGDWNDGGGAESPELELRGLVELPHPPGDFDGDGLSDDLERVIGTSIDDFDTDDDGVSDFDEHRGWGDGPWKTDPTDPDSDRDGLPDGLEGGLTEGVAQDRLRAIPGTNLAAFQPDLDPATRTHPMRADTDDDGAVDGFEDRNRDGKRDSNEDDPLDAGDQGLMLRSSGWEGNFEAWIEISGAEPGAKIELLGARSLSWYAEGQNRHARLAPQRLSMGAARVDSEGVAHFVVPEPERLLGMGLEWIQVVEVSTDGFRRPSLPLQISLRRLAGS